MRRIKTSIAVGRVRGLLGSAILALGTVLIAGDGGGDSSPAEPTYYGDVQPILAEHCGGCHTGRRPKGRFRAEDVEDVLRGGESGAAVVPGDAAGSLLVHLVRREGDPAMPPDEEDRLAPEVVDIIRRWIDAGAPPGEKHETVPYARRPEPPVYPRPAPITALAFAPDGSLLFVAGHREVLVHEAAILARDDGSALPTAFPTPRARLVGEAERIHAIVPLPGGRWLALAGGSPGRFGEVQLWDLQSNRLAAFRRYAGDTFFAAAFVPGAEMLVVGGADGALRWFSLPDLEPGPVAPVHSDWVLDLAYSPRTREIWSTGREGSVKALGAATGELLESVATLGEPAGVIISRPQGSEFLIAGERIFHFAASGRKERRKETTGVGQALAARFAPDGESYAIAGDAGRILVRSTEKDDGIASFDVGDDWSWALAFTGNGKRLIAGGHAGRIRVFDLAGAGLLAEIVPFPLGAIEGTSRSEEEESK